MIAIVFARKIKQVVQYEVLCSEAVQAHELYE